MERRDVKPTEALETRVGGDVSSRSDIDSRRKNEALRFSRPANFVLPSGAPPEVLARWLDNVNRVELEPAAERQRPVARDPHVFDAVNSIEFAARIKHWLLT